VPSRSWPPSTAARLAAKAPNSMAAAIRRAGAPLDSSGDPPELHP
jgi:hypothetical protein